MIFGSAAPVYQAKGWTGTLPLPVNLKFPPPDNSTGNYPSIDPNTVEDWLEEVDGNSNIGLRMATVGKGFEVIGIDIDQYDAKTGWDTYTALTSKLGELPPTYKSSARGAENPGGIHFFRVPAGKKWKGKPGADIDVIQRTHRYAVVWPSHVPDKHDEAYAWYQTDLDGLEAVLVDEPPHVTDLPLLPKAWVDHLLSGKRTERTRAAGSVDISMSDAWKWMKDNFPGYDEKPSSTMAGRIEEDVLAAEMEAGAHDAMVSKMHSVVRLGVEGHHGLSTALKAIFKAFSDEVIGAKNEESARRSQPEAKAEWERALAGEIGKLRQDIEEGYTQISAIGGYSADDADTDTDGIRSIIKRLADRRSREVDVEEYADNHRGIAKMIRDFWGSDLRPIMQTTDWAFWDDAHKRLTQLKTPELYYLVELSVEIPLRRAAEQRYDRADVLEENGADESDVKRERKDANELMRRSTNAGNVATMESSLKVGHALPGERVYLKNFDTNVLTLGVKNGVVDLDSWKAKQYSEDLLREGSSADLILYNTGVPYADTASSPLWDDYLDTFLPDLEYRRFVRKVFGYSIMGGNPRRLIIFLQGRTSTGKSTLIRAVEAALGDYATTVAANALFREKQDAGPAPELLTALPKRVVFSSEVGQRNRFHSDVIKRLTGGDDLAARALYSNEVVVRRPMFTPMVATNSAPTIADGDEALWRRLLVLPFDTQVPESSIVQEPIEDNPAAVAAVLCWLIEGLKDYLIESLDPSTWPEIVRNRQTQFISGTGDFQKFLSSHVARAEGEFVERDKLYTAYQAWSAAEGIKDSIPRNWFVRRLSENGIESSRKSFRSKSTDKVSKKTVFEGIKMAVSD